MYTSAVLLLLYGCGNKKSKGELKNENYINGIQVLIF